MSPPAAEGPSVVLTIGHSTRSLEEFLGFLVDLAEVRLPLR
jgi:hypothetical protein